MGGIFPFEVGKVMNLQATTDNSLERVYSPDIPPQIELYIAKSLKNDLIDPMIIDYAKWNDIYLTFVPVLPRPLKEYDFFESSQIEANDALK
nr:hypothetical protein DSAG12_03303 [Candidatus Prometheoarchaeum syntrophicum]